MATTVFTDEADIVKVQNSLGFFPDFFSGYIRTEKPWCSSHANLKLSKAAQSQNSFSFFFAIFSVTSFSSKFLFQPYLEQKASMTWQVHKNEKWAWNWIEKFFVDGRRVRLVVSLDKQMFFMRICLEFLSWYL